MPEDILTVPTETESVRTLFVHGNEYLSFPEIRKDGGLMSANVLHMGANGLIEFSGGRFPLAAPYLRVEGLKAGLRGKTVWGYRDHWLPSFHAYLGDLTVKGVIFAPPGHRGAVYLLSLKNTGSSNLSLEAGFTVRWGAVNRRVFQSREVHGCHSLRFDDWTNSLILEAEAGLPLASLAFTAGEGGAWRLLPAGKNEIGRAVAAKKLWLAPGQEYVLPLYLAANIEGSGAGTTVVDLRRHGYTALLKDTKAWLRERTLQLSRHQAIANRNLFFNYFFALGRTIDTDELAMVTSRSPLYYVSGAFWGRDCLLWSFPGVLLADRETARQVLVTVFRRHLDRAGEHAHYMNGVLLYPGFELDQLAAYVLALKAYLACTGDRTVLKEAEVARGLGVVAQKLLAQRDGDTGLYSTFLDPSDDPVKLPFLIYDNALAERALNFLGGLQKEGELVFDMDLTACAVSLRETIYAKGIVDGPSGPMFAWSVDGNGKYELYDNPPGSLQLLAHYGFCRYTDPVFRNTVRWIHSKYNAYYIDRGPVRGAASRHAVNPWPLAAANDLLALNLDKGEFFRLAAMDNSLCCETVTPENGRASTGQAFASAAGFLAYALWQAFGEGRDSERRQS